MWNETLGRLIATYPSGVLSSVEDDGYPISIRCQVQADAEHQRIIILEPPALAATWRGPASLLFHTHDARLERLRQLALQGELVQEQNRLTFVVEQFITANGRKESDQMPHASSPLHMLRFFFLGWRKARRYLANRAEPWPPIPYDEIIRLIAHDPNASAFGNGQTPGE